MGQSTYSCLRCWELKLHKPVYGLHRAPLEFKQEVMASIKNYAMTRLCGFVDAGWTERQDICMSTSGFILMLNGATVLWESQLHTEAALSTREGERVGVSMAQGVAPVNDFVIMTDSITNPMPRNRTSFSCYTQLQLETS